MSSYRDVLFLRDALVLVLASMGVDLAVSMVSSFSVYLRSSSVHAHEADLVYLGATAASVSMLIFVSCVDGCVVGRTESKMRRWAAWAALAGVAFRMALSVVTVYQATAGVVEARRLGQASPKFDIAAEWTRVGGWTILPGVLLAVVLWRFGAMFP